MEIRKVPISLLNAAPYNPRKDLQPGDPEYQKIARSIEKYGCVEPIIWNEKTGNMIGGHQRLKVLAATGAVEVDVSVVQLSLEDEKALNLALNKISGQWDNEKLSAVLQDLSAGFDVEVTGFDQHEVDALVASFAESGHEYELPGSEPYINNFFDSGVQAKPKAEEPAAAPAPEAPAQDAEMNLMPSVVRWSCGRSLHIGCSRPPMWATPTMKSERPADSSGKSRWTIFSA